MIIQSAAIQFAQKHTAQQLLEQQSQQRTQIRSNDPAPEGPRRLVVQTQNQFDYRQAHHERFQSVSEVQGSDGRTQEFRHHQALEAMTQLHLSGQQAQVAALRAFPVSNPDDTRGEGITLSGDVQFELTHQMRLQQSESSQMAAKGQITLEDGRQIRFDLFMQHQTRTDLQATSHAELSLATFQDPLVINFGTERTRLTDQVFEFDLNGDGETQSLAGLGHGSGYLALDLNGDGTINDGSELFGPQSGNGFNDLAVHDADGNGWIDENDPIFDQLKLWMPQQGSNGGALTSLSEKGVGAIYLEQAAQTRTHFGHAGETLGRTHAGSIVVMENGDVRTAEAIDLADRHTEAAGPFAGVSQKLEEMAAAFNERQRQWEERFGALWQTPQGHQAVNQAQDKAQETKAFFDKLQAQIEEIVAQRKAMLERVQQRYQH
ncbi:VCBS repeat-containing protein [Thiomicrospira sp. WB1]|uniref:FG-GAP repeat domain-containing protein n=1 Tax=Thiomicrospira sp. WB1 TaxID=1685380 RepID=UPI00074A428A|nr:VCBS repeat-containing protein [Thiomicrospira sp. WB1]KUJ71074.1 hypothetical protein AVO41_09390 [Thiomicrospira sp. WB1]